MDSPSRIPVMPTSNVRSRVLGTKTPPAVASPSRIPVMPTSNIRSRVLGNRPPPAMITQAGKRENRHSRRSTSISSLGQSLSRNISKILPKNRKEKGGTLRDVEDPFVDADELHIVATTTQLKKRAVIADLVNLFDRVAKKPEKSARRVPSFTGGLGLSWINRRNSFEWERVENGTTGESQLEPKKAGTFKKLWGSLKHRTGNTTVGLNEESHEDKKVDETRVSITPSEVTDKEHVRFFPNSEVNNAMSNVIITPTERITADNSNIIIAPTEHITAKKSDIVVAQSEHIKAVKSDIVVAPNDHIAAKKSDIGVAQSENITGEKSDVVVVPTEHIAAEKSDIVVALTENIIEKNEKRARHEERRSFRQSDDYLGIQGANPQTGLIDSSPVVSSTDVSEEDSRGTHEWNSSLSEATKATLAAVHETRRQTKLEARLKQEKINRARRVKLDTRNLGFRQKAQESGRWRSSDGHWSYQPGLTPVKELNNFVDNRKLQQIIVDEQQPHQSIVDEQQLQQSIVDDQKLQQSIVDYQTPQQRTVDDPKLQQSIVDGQKLHQSIVDGQKPHQSIVDDQHLQQSIMNDQQPQKIIVHNRQTADETVNTNVERTSFLSLPTPPESPKCATTIICTSTIGFYVQELPAMIPVRDDREDIADHSVRLNHLLEGGRGDIADHSFNLMIGIMEDIETIHGLIECISIEGIDTIDIESMINNLDTIQDIMKEIGVIYPSVIDLEAVEESVIDQKVGLEAVEVLAIDEKVDLGEIEVSVIDEKVDLDAVEVLDIDEKVDLEVIEASFIDEESIMTAFRKIEIEVESEVNQLEDNLLEFILVQDIIVEDNVVGEIILEKFDVKVGVENADVKLFELEDIDVDDILNAFDIVEGVMGNAGIKTTAPPTTSFVEEKRYDIADHFADLEIIEMKDLVRGGLIGGMVIAAAALGAYVLKSH